MSGLITTFPQIIWLSQYKVWVFTLSGAMIALSAYFQYQARFVACPIDPEQAAACSSGRKWSLRILIFSAVVWVAGAFFAFLAPILLV